MIGSYELDSINHCDLFALCDGLPDASVDMVLADLPYGTTACAWDIVIPFAPMWERFKRVIKPRGAIVLTASQPFTSALVMSNVEMFRYTWHWNKGNGTGHLDANKRPLRQVEDVAVFYAEQCTYNPQMIRRDKPEVLNAAGRRKNIGGSGKRVYGNHMHMPPKVSYERYPTNYLQFSFGNKADLVHPTQKPVALFEYLIRTYTREGELVLDPCVGSGTTALAARNAKRHWICGDSDSHYCDVASDSLRLPFEAKRVKASDDVSDLPLFAPAALDAD